MDLSIIIPSFNGGEMIKKLVRKINDLLRDKFTFEILIVFDNGSDITWKSIKDLKDEFPDSTNVYHLAKNYGQHRAIQFGFGKAKGDFVVTIDEDLQHDPSDIFNLIEMQKNGSYDIVYGRFSNQKNNGVRNFISTSIRKILKHFIPSLYEDYSPYRLIKSEIAFRTSTMVCPYTFIDDFLSRVTQNIAFVDISHFKRNEGHSSYTFVKLLKHGIFILLAYSRIISWLLVAAGLITFFGALLLILNIKSPFLNYPIIIKVFGVGLFLIIISLLGTFINHRNVLLNTREVKVLNENSL